jgi:hypothetical protein
MSAGFTRSLEAVLARTDADSPPAKATVRPQDAAERSRKWFAKFAEKRVMPLLAEAAQAAEKYGVTATFRLHETEGRLTAELVVIPRHLPQGIRPPRLTVYAPGDERPLEIEYTGTFPGIGVDGGFGSEVDYDAIYPAQLEEKILEFVALATGA